MQGLATNRNFILPKEQAHQHCGYRGGLLKFSMVPCLAQPPHVLWNWAVNTGQPGAEALSPAHWFFWEYKEPAPQCCAPINAAEQRG